MLCEVGSCCYYFSIINNYDDYLFVYLLFIFSSDVCLALYLGNRPLWKTEVIKQATGTGCNPLSLVFG